MQKWHAKSDENGLQKGPQKWAKIIKMGSKSHSKTVFKKTSNNYNFQHPWMWPKCVRVTKINDFRVLVLGPFWVSFWECFGSPNGGQNLQKVTSKKHKKMMPKMTSNWSQRGSQNGAKIIKNEVLEAPCFKGGSQVASRPPPGSILERFWDHFGTMFVSFSNICVVIFACIL